MVEAFSKVPLPLSVPQCFLKFDSPVFAFAGPCLTWYCTFSVWPWFVPGPSCRYTEVQGWVCDHLFCCLQIYVFDDDDGYAQTCGQQNE